MALMMRFRWNKPCAADGCWLTSPGNAAERGMGPEGIHAKAAEATFPARFPAPDNAHPNAWVRTVPREIPSHCQAGLRVVSAGPGGRPQPAGGDVEMGQASGSPCGSRPPAWSEVTWMLTASTCWMTTCLAMNSWTASWPPPSQEGATSPLVTAATSFRM